MKILFCLLMFATLARAQTAAPSNPSPIVATAGPHVVSAVDLDAEMTRVPPDERIEKKQSARFVANVMENLLIYRELKSRATAVGFDKDPVVARTAHIAAERQIGVLYLEKLVDEYTAGLGDLTTAARERYDVSKDKLKVEERVSVAHILIGPKDRTEAQALQRAQEVEIKVRANPDPVAFEKLVHEYSDDPSIRTNHGRLGVIGKGQMVKQFEAAAFALSKPGEISPVVKTPFGFHIIRLDQRIPAHTPSFESLKPQIIADIRQQAAESFKAKLLGDIKNRKDIVVDDVQFQGYTGADRIKPSTTAVK